MSESMLLTFYAVAQELCCSVALVKRRVRAGSLPVFRDGRLVRVRRVDLEAYIAARTVCLTGDEGSQRVIEGHSSENVAEGVAV